jgi:Ca2+-binding RTX toxin-like protein
MATSRTLSGARASFTAAANDTVYAAGISDTLIGSGANSLIAASNSSYLIAGTGSNTLLGASLSSNFTTLVGNARSTLQYAGANNTFILNSSVAGGSGLDYKTDTLIASGSALARSSVIQTSLNKFDLSNTANHGAGVLDISRLIYTGSGNATLHGNNQNNSIVGGRGANSLSSAGTTGKSTLDGHFSNVGNTLVGNGTSSLIGSSLNDTYVISETVSSGKITQSDKIFEGAAGGIDLVSLNSGNAPALFDLSSLINIENLSYSGNQNASLYGSTLNNSIKGGRGNNVLQSNGGSDTLDASASSGSSTLIGSSNAPSSLIGGRGTNTFYIYNAADTFTAQDGSQNNIFSVSQKIDLSNAKGRYNSVTYLGTASEINLNSNSLGGTMILAGKATSATLGDGGAPLGSTLVGSSIGANLFNVTAAGLINDSIVGGSGTDILRLSTSTSTLGDSAFSKVSSVEILQLTSNSSVSLGVNASTAGISTVIAGVGSDTINASAFTSRGLVIDASANASRNKYTGTANNDLVKLGATALATSTINGGAGTDTLQVVTSGTNITTFGSNITGVEVLSLTGGGNKISGFASGTTLVAAGTGGADTIDASSSTTSLLINASQATSGETLVASSFVTSTLIGGAGNDYLSVASNRLAGDSIKGGAGTDTLRLSTSSLNLSDAAFSGASSVEVLQLTSNSSLNLGVKAAAAGISTIITGSVSDTINASAFTTRGLVIDASASSLTQKYTATASNDLVKLTATALPTSTVAGGAGTDTLQVVTSGANISSFGSNIIGIEVLSLTGGGNKISGFATGTTLVAAGTGGGDTIDAASSVTPLVIDASKASTGESLIASSSAATTLIGGSGNDSLSVSAERVSGNSIVGGAGTDTLQLRTPTSPLSLDLSRVSSVEVLQLGANSAVSLTGTSSISTVVAASGRDSVDASAFTSRGLVFDASSNSSGQQLTGTGLNDLIKLKSSVLSSSSIAGGAGTDTLQVVGSGVSIGFAQTSKLSSIDVLSLSGGGNTIVNLGSSGITSIIGGNLGGDTVDTAASNSSLYIDESRGTLGDLFLVNGRTKLSQSTLIGSSSASDTLRLSGGSTNFLDSDFKNLRNIETLSLIGSNSTINAGTYASGANIRTFVLDQTPNTLNASSYLQGITVVDSLGSGADSILGGRGNDLFILKGGANNIGNAIVNGTAGVDTLALTSSSTLSGTGRLSNISVLSLVGGNDRISNIGQTGISSIVGVAGGDTISAVNATKAVFINESRATAGNLYAFSDASILGNSTIKGSGLSGSQGDTLQLAGGAVSLSDTSFKNHSDIRSLYITGANNKIQLNDTSYNYAYNAGIRNVILDGSQYGLNGNNIYDDYGRNSLNPDTLTFNGSTTLSADQNGSAVGFNTIVLTGGNNSVQNLSNILGEIRYFQNPTIVGSAQGQDTIDVTAATSSTALNSGIYVDGSKSNKGNTLTDNNPKPTWIVTNTLIGSNRGGNLFQVASEDELTYNLYLKGGPTSVNGTDSLSFGDNQLKNTDESGNYYTTFRQVSSIENLLLTSKFSGKYDLGSGDAIKAGISSVFGSQSTNSNATLGGDEFYIHSALYLDASRATLGDNFGINSAYTSNGNYTTTPGVQSESVLKNSTLIGGSGNDTLTFMGNSLAAGDFANKSRIEVLSLVGAKGNYILGADAFNAGISTIETAAYSNQQTVDAGTSNKSLTFVDNGWKDHLSGTSLGDIFQYGPNSYFYNSTISGGNGTDTLLFTSNNNIDDYDLANKKSVEIISLQGGANSVDLGENAFYAGVQAVYGGSVSNTLDASAYTSGYITLDGSKATQGDSLIGVSSFSANATLIGRTETVSSGTATNYFVLPSTDFLSHNSLVAGASHTNILQISRTDQTISDHIFRENPNNPDFVGNSSHLNQLSLRGGRNSVVLGSNFDTWKSANAASRPFTIKAGNQSSSSGRSPSDTLNVSNTKSDIVLDGSASGSALTQLGESLIGSSLGGRNTLIGAQSGYNTFVIKDGSALRNASIFGGTNNNDTLAFSDTITTSPGAFSKVKNIAALETRSAGNNVVLGTDALRAGITTLIGGLYGDTGGDTFDVSSFKPSGKSVLIEITDKNYLDNLTFIGSGNSDTLRYSAAGVSVTDADLAGISNLAVLQASGGTNHFLISDAFEDTLTGSGIKTLIGGGGSDTVDLTSSDYTAPNGGITYSLAAGYTFLSSINNLSYATIVGNNGDNNLQFSDAGIIGDRSFAGMSQANLTALNLSSDSSNTATLGVNASKANIQTVDLGDLGDTIDLTTFTGRLKVNGGSSSDLVTTSLSEFSQLTFQSGSGTDTLQIIGSAAASIVDYSLTGSSYEALVLSNGNNFIQLTQPNSSGLSSIYGSQGFGTDTINVQGFRADQGVDMIIDFAKLGRGSSYDLLTGGAGNDTLQIGGSPLPWQSGVFDENSFSQIHSIEALALNTYGKNAVNLGYNSKNAGISTIYGSTFDGNTLGGFDTINAAAFGKAVNVAVADTLTLSTDSIIGSGYNDTLSFTSSGQIITDSIFDSISTKVLALSGSGNQVSLGGNSSTAGISTVYGGVGGGNTLGEAATYGSGALYFVLHGDNNLIEIASASQLSADTINFVGSTGDNSLKITAPSNIADTAFDGISSNSVNTLQFTTGTNSVTMGPNLLNSGIHKVIGGSGNDLIDASIYKSNATLDGGGSGYDTLVDSQSYVTTFVLANNVPYGQPQSYYAPGTGFATIKNYFLVDHLVLNNEDFSKGLYSIGNSSDGQARTGSHFGIYNNNNLVADISLTNGNFLATDGSQDLAAIWNKAYLV